MRRLIILGAGGYGKTIEDVASQLNRYKQISFLDDKAEGKNVLGKTDDFKNFINDETEFYPAFGDNELRYNWILRLDEAGASIATVIHQSAYISPKAVIGKESAILPNASINYGAVVKGENLIPAFIKIESGTVITRAQCPCQVHYIPVYWMPMYQDMGYKKGLCPVAEDIYKGIVSIPLYPKLTEEDVDSVIEAVIKLVNWYKKK